MQPEAARQLQADRLAFQREMAASRRELLEETRREIRALQNIVHDGHVERQGLPATERGTAATSPTPAMEPGSCGSPLMCP